MNGQRNQKNKLQGNKKINELFLHTIDQLNLSLDKFQPSSAIMFLSSRELHFFEKSAYFHFATLDSSLKEEADVYLGLVYLNYFSNKF